MSRARRRIVTALHIASVTFLAIAVLMFPMAAVQVVVSHGSGPRTAAGRARVPRGDIYSRSVLSTTTTTVGPVAPPARPAVSQPGQCHTADLAITDSGGQESGGMFFGTIVLRNITNAPCTLYGYAGIQRRDGRGRPLPTTVLRDRTRGTVLVTVAPQQPASFGYSTVHTPSGRSALCSRATTIDVTPPDETAHANVASNMVACRPGGIVSVGPVEPGLGASIGERRNAGP